MLLYILLGIIILLIAYYLYFNRDPERKIPKTGIVAPADGKVLEVTTVDKKAEFKKGIGYTSFTTDMKLPATMIRIFLNPFDVHVQRAPIEGTIQKVKHYLGKHAMAFKPTAWQNERAEITIKSQKGPVKVVLIAGILARRIRTFVKKGQKIQKGQRIGKILLGSQVCVLLPKCKTKTKRGEKVQAGTSIIA
ncbi:phosphatidylserine decarboxylase [Candidatus Woesearchaeota archaeon]|nr:phosphatidylserine decarboxylase [Candidatus Woesearchaeota archaeon]